MYLVISLLVLRAGYGIWLYQFLIIAYLFTSLTDTYVILNVDFHRLTFGFMLLLMLIFGTNNYIQHYDIAGLVKIQLIKIVFKIYLLSICNELKSLNIKTLI